MKGILIVILLGLLTACQSTQQVQTQPDRVLNDDAFPEYTLFPVESEQEVFALDDDAKAFVGRIINPIYDPIDRMETLIEQIFDRSELNLLYMGNANTTASETFHNRAANCLSLSIMAYSMAKEAGFSVRFQDIDIPEYWTRRDGFSLLNGHINLKIMPRPTSNVVQLIEKGFEVDFDPQASRNHFPKSFVDRDTILAMFYNNKGADALLANSYTKAYSYFRAAIKVDPEFDSAYVNLGFLYRLNGFYQNAENSYSHALEIDVDNLTAWENLAYLYSNTGQPERAEEIMVRVEQRREDNPFYHFILGEQEFENENYQGALGHYRTALRLDKSRHEIFYGLAKTYYQLGDVNRSARYFKKAIQRSRTDQDQQRYQGKLDFLSRRDENKS